MGKKTRSVGSYTCALCKKGFTRRATVKDPHFPRCVAKNGNPKNLVWDEHPSCWVKLPDGTKGKSGFIPPGVSQSRLDSDEDGSMSSLNNEADEGNEEDEETEDEDHEWDGCSEEGKATNSVGSELDPRKGLNSSSWTPINGSPASHAESTLPKLAPSPEFNTHKKSQPPSHRLPLSYLTMNQLANVTLSASRKYAGLGDVEAADIWNLWHSLLPQGVISSILAPACGQSQKERQQAVVWLAQDVYAALLVGRHDLEDQLKLITLWRNITKSLGDKKGLTEIYQLLMEALGENDPMVLERIYRENPAINVGLMWDRSLASSSPGRSHL